MYGYALEIIPTNSDYIIVNSTGNILPAPQQITVGELALNGNNYQSELIRLNAVFNEGSGDPWPLVNSNAFIIITDNDIDNAVLYIDEDTGIDGSPEPPWPRDIIGVASVSVYNDSTINPRLISDFSSCTPTPFELLYPVNDTIIETLTPEFLWETSSDPDDSLVGQLSTRSIIGYELSLGLDSTLGGVVPYEVTGISYVPTESLFENQLYYWAVSAIGDSGDVVYSDIASFLTNSENELPSPPILLSPENGASGLTATPSFHWDIAFDPDPGDFAVYTLQISTDSSFSSLAFEVFTDTSIQYQMAIWMPTDAEYWWRVVATDTDSLSTVSETFKFTVGYVDDAAAILAVSGFIQEKHRDQAEETLS